MQYQSTRGASLGRFSDILLQGLAPDGGLAMPEHIPAIVTAMRTLRQEQLPQCGEFMDPSWTSASFGAGTAFAYG